MAITALERLRLLSDLRKQRALSADATGGLEKLRVYKAIRGIRTQLGMGAAEPAPGPAVPAPAPGPDSRLADFEARAVFAPRPAEAPVGWIVFNAPRPLDGGKEWDGDWTAGKFYAAVNPDDPDADRQIKNNADMGGRILVYFRLADAKGLLRAWYSTKFKNPDMADRIGEQLAKLADEDAAQQFVQATLNAKLRYGDLSKMAPMDAITPVLPDPSPPEPPEEDPNIGCLREVADGRLDNADLTETFGKIEAAVLALDAAGLLTGDAEAVAHAAITRWAENDERVNG